MYEQSVKSNNAGQVLDGRAEECTIELACDPVREGHSRGILDIPVSRVAM